MKYQYLNHGVHRLNSRLWNGPKEKRIFLTAEERIASVNNTIKNRRNKNDVEH
jgi:hypothetical protein